MAHMAQKQPQKIANAVLKAIFEMASERPISLRTWQRYKVDIQAVGLDLTLDNLKVLGQIRKQTWHMHIPFMHLIECYFQALNEPKSTMLGIDVFVELEKSTGACKTTIIRWFKGCERKNDCYFSQSRQYSKVELVPVFLAAKIYNVKKSPDFLKLLNQPTVTVNTKAA